MKIVIGITIALISSLFTAIVFAFVFRIPIPFGGYIGPFGKFGTYEINILETLKMVINAWIFYGILGGFIIIPALGAIVTVLTNKLSCDTTEKNKKIVIFAFCSGVVPVFVISILDCLIGPW